MPNRDLLEEGISFFNTGRYYEAHEVWEDLWRETEGQLKAFYQGLIHAAVGLHHLNNDNVTGASNQIQKSIRRLSEFAGDSRRIDRVGLIRQLSTALIDGSPKDVRIVRSN